MAYVREDVRVTAAIIAGNRGEMDGAAHRVKSVVLAEAAKHRLTGAYSAGIRVERVPGELGTGRQVADRVVSSTDPGTLSIEYGHLQRFANSRRVKWVPGQHIMQNAMAAVR